jgi:hypothetical protein
MKWLPQKDNIEMWEVYMTLVITIIVGAELIVALIGISDAKDQYSIMKDLKNSSLDQAAKLEKLTDEQNKALASLIQMNTALQSSVQQTTKMTAAMEKQLKLFQQEEANRKSQFDLKPKLAALSQRYYAIERMICTPVQIGKPRSGAAITPERCDAEYGAWAGQVQLKTIALMRKVRHRGTLKVDWIFTFACAAYNLVRMRNLMRSTVST